MKLKESRRKQINNLVEAIRQNANLPIPLTLDNLNQFVQDLGGTIRYDRLNEDTDGCIVRNGNNFTITLNSINLATEERQKFTLCHELGHLFLHLQYLDNEFWANTENYEDSSYARSGYSEEEYDAHEFAAALLMPKDKYMQIVRNNINNNICNITAVAKYFGVSIDVATNRGKWLSIFEW